MEFYTELRKQNYGYDLRGKYVQFIEHIHDIVRCGEVERLSAPLSVYWAVTGRCNLKCTHCYASKMHKIPNVEVDINVAKKIVDLLCQINIAELIIEGGEPTLYSRFIELMQYIKSKGISVTVLSNGTCLSDDIIKCINGCFDDYDAIQISIDGFQNSCNAIRGEGVYEKVMHSIRMLKVHIIVNCVVTVETIDSIPELCNILFKIPNIRTFHLSPLMQSGKGVFHQAPTFASAYKLLSNLKNKYGNWISGTAIEDAAVLSQKDISFAGFKNLKLGCCAGRSKMYINEAGKAYSCDFLQDGNGVELFDEDFDIVWKGNWNKQAKNAQKVSLEMQKIGEFLPFCLNTEI